MSRSSFASYKIRELKSRLRRGKKRLNQALASIRGNAGLPPVTLVAGVQRSGTNMLMNVLDRSAETDVYMEKDHRAFSQYAMRSLDEVDALRRNSMAKHFVIKALMESHRVVELMAHFGDDSRTLWLYRDVYDMVNSYMVSWPGGRNRLDEVMRADEEGIWQAQGMTSATRSELETLYRPDMNDASALGLCWYYRNQLFFDQKLESCQNTRLIKYEDLVTKPEVMINRVAQFLGIEATLDMTRLISARSIRKRPKPDIDTNIERICAEMADRLDSTFEMTNALG